MAFWYAARRFATFLLALAIAYCGWVFVSRNLSRSRGAHQPSAEENARAVEFNRTFGGSDLRILQFYARDAVATEGVGTVICYGVLNAKSVRIEPPLEGVTVALNRCVDAAPEHDTRYTLTAEDAAGHTVSASFQLPVKADESQLPKVSYFKVAKDRVEDGRHLYLVTFGQQNGDEISIDPPEFPTLHGAPYGQFYVSPRQTTTYTLTVKGKRGHVASRKLTIQIPQ